ncbi:flagellar protein FlaG [Ureibacillus massiliensis 4400831 = CIP 108448 = CCUG 49529]|uniref:Flagellar protein FlaG n=1 Tax=Ureibacillus massiliensis 4400831 = CIP 108448 = CCUG 49529 TaxID=1211035 RepID=A0A0A3IZF2_9BACL|nr:flagellar protein FlaG [Ureibacillus massiliensis]KGR90106.1 flagellar protein FlaG [Ureibacillus massiliensis 4400831 = CIP 108448 = CCUG 49529]
MRILSQSAVDTQTVSKTVQSSTVENIAKQGSLDDTTMQIQQGYEKNEVTEEKLEKAVNSLNEILEINHNSSKFVYHEGLDRYFVQVVNKDTEEVVKEIPPKKLLDAFYEMQKLVGMIVDEKI